MKIVLDSNPIFQDFTLSSVQMQILERYISRFTDDLCIPEVVVEEVVREFRQKYEGTYSNVRKATILTKVIGSDLPSIPPVDEAVNIYKEKLRSRLLELDAIILPIPNISIRTILERDINTRKPFDPKGRGFRDTLIWESILSHVEAHKDKTILISKDNAFKTSGADESISLHPDLRADLRSIGLDEELVTIVEDLHVFNKNYVLPTLERVFRKGDPIEGTIVEGLDPQEMLTRYQPFILEPVYDQLLDVLSISRGSVGQARFLRWPEEAEILEAFGLGNDKVQTFIRVSLLLEADIHVDQNGFDSILQLSSQKHLFVSPIDMRWNPTSRQYDIVVRVYLTLIVAMVWDKSMDKEAGIELVDVELKIWTKDRCDLDES